MTEDTLFDDRGNPAVRMTTTGAEHPPTSHQAADRIRPMSGTQRAEVLRVVAYRDMTDEEIGHLLQMNPSSVRPRRGELVDMGWLADSGHRRFTQSGAKAIVWTLVP